MGLEIPAVNIVWIALPCHLNFWQVYCIWVCRTVTRICVGLDTLSHAAVRTPSRSRAAGKAVLHHLLKHNRVLCCRGSGHEACKPCLYHARQSTADCQCLVLNSHAYRWREYHPARRKSAGNACLPPHELCLETSSCPAELRPQARTVPNIAKHTVGFELVSEKPKC